MSTYRWRLACDTVKPTRPFYLRYWTRKTQAERVEQAQHCWVGGLISERCTFGHRRLVLEGVIEQVNTVEAHKQGLLVAMWTLYTVYGMEQYRDPYHAPEMPRLDVRVREVPSAAEPEVVVDADPAM